MVKHTTFVTTWVRVYKESGTAQDVARRLNLDIAQVRAKAAQLRQRGVELPQLNRATSNPLDVDALNSLIKAQVA